MAEFTLPANSKVTSARPTPAPAGAKNVKTAFKVYRWDPDTGENPRVDTYESTSTPAGRWSGRADQDQERDRPDADLPPLLPRRHLRLVRDEHRRHQHARLHQGHRRVRGDVKIYPLPHMPVVKDLVPDLTTSTRSTPRSSRG
jgi:succinate dehydrogenase / fumarate reductase iron-sulfur subunit